MKVKQIIFKFEEDKNEFSFDENINVLENKKLIRSLSKENIRNQNSSLIILSMNNLPIYDVIQLKVNLSETGVFLVNFSKEEFTENIREDAIKKIKELKDDSTPTKEIQIEKIKKLLKILDEFHPIYATYRSKDDINVEPEDFNKIGEEITWSYPLIILNIIKKPTKQISIQVPDFSALKKLWAKLITWVKKVKLPKVKKERVKKVKPEKIKKEKPPKVKKEKVRRTFEKKIIIDFPLFTYDYLWNGIFSLSFSFTILVATYQALDKNSICAAIFALGVLFLAVEYFSIYSTLYKKNEEKFKLLKYWLLSYLLVGAAIGLIVGFVIAKNVLKAVNPINYGKLLAISIPSTLGLSLLGIYFAKLISLIIKKIKK